MFWGVFCENCGRINKEDYCFFNHIIYYTIFILARIKSRVAAGGHDVEKSIVKEKRDSFFN